MSNLFEVFGQGLADSVGDRLGLGVNGGPSGRRARDASNGPHADGSWEAQLERAHERFRRGCWHEALERFESAARANPCCLPALLGAAACCDRLGQLADCVRRLEQAAEVDKGNAAIHLAQGQCLEAASRCQEARSCYEAALNADDSQPDAHLRLAAMYLSVGRYDAAARQYRRVHELAPENSAHTLALAHLILATGDVDEAIDHFERAITLEPDTWQAGEDLAASLERAGRLEEAIEQLEHALVSQPVFADTYVRLGDLYAKVGRDRMALQHYLRAVEIYPDYLEATVKVGTHHLRQARYYESAEWFNRGVAINDRLLAAYCALGYAHLLAGHRDGVATCLELAAAIEPNSTLLVSEVARLQLRVSTQTSGEPCRVAPGGEQEALAMMDKLVDYQIDRLERHRLRRPNHAQLHYNLGMLFRQRGRLDRAVECFKRAVRINPLFTRAHVGLAIMYREAGELASACGHLRLAFQVPHAELPTLYVLALLSTRSEPLLRAASSFEQRLSCESGYADFPANLNLMLRTLGMVPDSTAGNPFSAWDLAAAPAERVAGVTR